MGDVEIGSSSSVTYRRQTDEMSRSGQNQIRVFNTLTDLLLHPFTSEHRNCLFNAPLRIVLLNSRCVRKKHFFRYWHFVFVYFFFYKFCFICLTVWNAIRVPTCPQTEFTVYILFRTFPLPLTVQICSASKIFEFRTTSIIQYIRRLELFCPVGT